MPDAARQLTAGDDLARETGPKSQPVHAAVTDEAVNLLAQALLAKLAEQATAAEGLDAAEAARFIGVSRSMWHNLVSRGMCPSAIEIGTGRCPRWCRTELRAWLLAGAPSRALWSQLRADALRRAS